MAKRSGLADRFELARDTFRYRLIASLEGEVGTGKTHFGLTAPGPILIQNIDRGTEGVIEKFRNGVIDTKEIYEEYYDWEPAGLDDDEDTTGMDLDALVAQEKRIQEQAIALRDKWEKDFFYALDNGVRTIITDTESRLWQVYRYSFFGGPNGDAPKDFDRLNMRFERLANRVKATDANLLFIRSMKDKWGMYGAKKKDGSRSFGKGGREVWGYEHLPGVVNEELTFVRRSQEEQDKTDDGLGEYVIKIGKCRIAPHMQFTIQPRCAFAELGSMLVEGSSEEEWL